MDHLASARRDLETTGAAGAALLLLFAGVVTNRYRFDAVPLRPHPEHFALALAVLVLGFLFLRRRAQLVFHPADLLLLGYLLVALVSSLLFSDQPRESVQYWLRMVLATAVYFVARWLIPPAAVGPAFRLGVKALLIFGVLEAGLGMVSWVLYPLGLNLGVDEYPLGVRGPGGILCNFSLTTYGTLWEPNVYASALVTVILIGAVLFVSSEFRPWRRWLTPGIALMLGALALNASRAALGTLALGLIVLVLVAGGMTRRDKLKWALAAVVLVSVVNVASLELSRALMRLPSAPGLAARAPCAQWIAAGMPSTAGASLDDPATGPESDSNAVNRLLEGQTLTSRWVSYEAAWGYFLKRPLLGNGANSFGFKFTTTAHTPGWISNLVLMSLHDTGLVGTALLVAWFVWYGWRAWRAWQQAGPGSSRTLLFAVGVGLAVLLVAYQATTMLWFGFIWWYLAVLEMGMAAVPRNPERIAQPAPTWLDAAA